MYVVTGPTCVDCVTINRSWHKVPKLLQERRRKWWSWRRVTQANTAICFAVMGEVTNAAPKLRIPHISDNYWLAGHRFEGQRQQGEWNETDV